MESAVARADDDVEERATRTMLDAERAGADRLGLGHRGVDRDHDHDGGIARDDAAAGVAWGAAAGIAGQIDRDRRVELGCIARRPWR
jgi:hypothetical protein